MKYYNDDRERATDMPKVKKESNILVYIAIAIALFIMTIVFISYAVDATMVIPNDKI